MWVVADSMTGIRLHTMFAEAREVDVARTANDIGKTRMANFGFVIGVMARTYLISAWDACSSFVRLSASIVLVESYESWTRYMSNTDSVYVERLLQHLPVSRDIRHVFAMAHHFPEPVSFQLLLCKMFNRHKVSESTSLVTSSER